MITGVQVSQPIFK